MMRKRVTLADVAKEAGVSVQTASHVMAKNMTVRLREDTRQRVVEAAARVGYRPNRLAQAMKAGKTDLIGVWIPLDRPILNYMIALREINKRANAAGYDLMIAGLMGQMAFSGEGRPPFSWPVDGLLAYDAGRAARRFREDPQNDSIPLAVVGLEEYANSDSAAWDLYGTYKSHVQALVARGAQELVHMTPKWVFDDYPREQRRRGYTEAMLEAGLEPVIIATPLESFASARDTFADYLSHSALPDVVLGFSDSLALGAARAILDKGARIPDECAVWGYGDYPESEFFEVPLSTIRVPVEDTVKTAWGFLESRILDQSLPHREALLPMELIVRQSG